MNTNSQVYIFGTRIDNLSKKEILDKIVNFVGQKKFHYIVTLNPEILLKTKKNISFQKIVNNSDLNISDGIGIKFAFWRYGHKLKSRYTGIDLMWDVLEIANRDNLQVFLLANENGLSSWQETAKSIKKVYPKLKIKGQNVNQNNCFDTTSIKSDILFTNFGAPLQEKILANIKKNNSVSLKLGIGVGGSFDYITGRVSRAPELVRNLGLEWLYRLIRQPNRFKRILTAVVIFPITILSRQKCK